MNFFDFVIASDEHRQLKSFSVNSRETLCGKGRLVPREREAMSLRGMECSSRLAE